MSHSSEAAPPRASRGLAAVLLQVIFWAALAPIFNGLV